MTCSPAKWAAASRATRPKLVASHRRSQRGDLVHSLRLADPTGDSPVTIEDACAYLAPPPVPVLPANVYGVNLSGGEFDTNFDSNGQMISVYGTDYAYPSRPQNSARSGGRNCGLVLAQIPLVFSK